MFPALSFISNITVPSLAIVWALEIEAHDGLNPSVESKAELVATPVIVVGIKYTPDVLAPKLMTRLFVPVAGL